LFDALYGFVGHPRIAPPAEPLRTHRNKPSEACW
jgi:hypothetical protein